MIQDQIAALDDKTAIHILQIISKSLMRTGTFETAITQDMADALQSAFDVSKPADKASEGDIARLALQLLSDDPKYSANITALISGSGSQKFSPDLGTISILIGALLVLQTHIKIEKDKWINYNSENSNITSQNIWCLVTDKDNNLWIGTGHYNKQISLMRFDGKKWETINDHLFIVIFIIQCNHK